MDDSYKSITFNPIVVERGRKFKGHGYALNAGVDTSDWCYSMSTTMVWDPTAKKIAYANSKFCIPEEVPTAKLEEDLNAYVESVISKTVKTITGSDAAPTDTETLMHIRYSLKHKLPIEVVDKRFPDVSSVSDQVQKTIAWAMSLRTRPCYIYGKSCPGGKQYPPKEVATKAYKALRRRGITRRPEFACAWKMYTTLNSLPDVSQDVEDALKDGRQIEGQGTWVWDD